MSHWAVCASAFSSHSPSHSAFAPGTSTMTFSPSSLTRMLARPVVAPGRVSTASTFTPFWQKCSRYVCPNPSSPTMPAMRVSTPSRASATA